MELTKDEQLALLVALNARIKPLLDDAKSDARQTLMEAFDNLGVDRKAIIANDEKVGEVGISYTTAKPSIRPGHEKDVLDILEAKGLTERVPVKGWEKHFTHAGDVVLDTETGEIVEGLEWSKKMPKNAVVRGCKPEDVLTAMQGKIGDQNILALIEGE